jgi:hypothetical protein
MFHKPPQFAGFILIATVLSIIGVGGRLCAQDDEPVPDAQQGAADQAQNPRIRVLRPRVFRQTWGGAQVSSFVFGKARTEAGAHHLLSSRLQARLREVERDYGLTPAQREKLHLAGQGDIKHFFDRLDNLKRKFLAMDDDQIQSSRLLMQEAGNLQKEIEEGILGADSLFSKTMTRTVTSDQVANAAAIGRTREILRHRTTVSETVATLSRALSLTSEQRRQFQKLLLEEIQPPRKSGDSRVAYVMFQATRISREKLRAIFEDDQWQLLCRFLSSYEDMEEFLKDDGFILDDNTPRRAPAAIKVRGNANRAKP